MQYEMRLRLQSLSIPRDTRRDAMGQVSEHFLAPRSQGAVIGTPRPLSSAIFLCEGGDLGFHDEQKEDADGCCSPWVFSVFTT